MYLAKMNIKDVIFHLFGKWVLHDVGWFRRRATGIPGFFYHVIIKCWKWKSLLIIHSLWREFSFHSGWEKKWWEKKWGDFSIVWGIFSNHICFFLCSLYMNISKYILYDSSSHPHSLTLHQWPDLRPLSCLILFPSATLAPWEPSIDFLTFCVGMTTALLNA